MPSLDQLLTGLGKQITLLLGWGVLLGAEFLPPLEQVRENRSVVVFEVNRYPQEEMIHLLGRSVSMEVRFRILGQDTHGASWEREVVRTLRYRTLQSGYFLQESPREEVYKHAAQALRAFFTLEIPRDGLAGCYVTASFRLPEADSPGAHRELWPLDPRMSWRAKR